MKRIVILGNALSGIKAIEELKRQGQELEALVISQENTFPYYRHLLPDLSGKKISQAKIFYHSPAEYEAGNINFIFDKKATRVNFKRGRLTLDDKDHVDYDWLLLTDTHPDPFSTVKGANKTGLFNLKRLADMSNFLKTMPLLETVVIQSDNLAGLKTAVALCGAGKEVILVAGGKNVLSGLLDEANAAMIDGLLQEAGVRLITQNRVAELLGDSEVKAIRLEAGKVIGCQAVLTDADIPDLRLFKDTELQFSQRVLVNEHYQTNIENVFALDAVCDRIIFSDRDVADHYPFLAEEQGKIVVSRIIGKDYISSAAPFSWTVDINLSTKLRVENNHLKFLADPGLALLQLQIEETVVNS